ncbi:hypothetical protein [Rhizocola hellebori]|uniref:hypothetical protein n=1 Tax=Rhizocola hellebori TaxID=1392758 RepID=UPI0019434E4D|nr:hypothetical protein [Rhizocola hellebori]
MAEAERAADDGDPWNELWRRLCHQGTVYSASYAALPALAEMSRRRAPSGYVPALHLAAAILASNDGAEDAAAARRRYETEVADLRTMASVNLQHAKDDTEFVYGLQALMAFEDGGVWQRNLDRLTDGELEFDCPSCGEHLLINLNDSEVTAESFSDGSLAATAVTPVEAPAATVEGRLLALARASDWPEVTRKLPYVFGTVACPRCHASFAIPKALT